MFMSGKILFISQYIIKIGANLVYSLLSWALNIFRQIFYLTA